MQDAAVQDANGASKSDGAALGLFCTGSEPKVSFNGATVPIAEITGESLGAVVTASGTDRMQIVVEIRTTTNNPLPLPFSGDMADLPSGWRSSVLYRPKESLRGLKGEDELSTFRRDTVTGWLSVTAVNTYPPSSQATICIEAKRGSAHLEPDSGTPAWDAGATSSPIVKSVVAYLPNRTVRWP